MHNLDRMIAQAQQETQGLYQEQNALQELEYSNELLPGESPFANESDEYELAQEFLEIQNEEEMGRFLRRVWGKVKKAGGQVAQNFSNSPEGQKIINVVKQSARNVGSTVLSQGGKWVGQGIGQAIDGQRGRKRFGKLLGDYGNDASNWYQQRPIFDGTTDQSGDDGSQEMEFYQSYVRPARNYVRFAGDAFRRYSTLPYRSSYPDMALRLAVIQSARRHYPELLGGAPLDGGLPSQGTWRLVGRSIVLDL